MDWRSLTNYANQHDLMSQNGTGAGAKYGATAPVVNTPWRRKRVAPGVSFSSPENTGAEWGVNPNNPAADNAYSQMYQSVGISVPQGGRSLYAAPPPAEPAATVLQGGVEQKGQPMSLLMQELMGLKPQGPAADELRSRLSAHFGGKGGGRQARVNSAGRITSTAKKGAPPGKYFPEIDGPSGRYQAGDVMDRLNEISTAREEALQSNSGGMAGQTAGMFKPDGTPNWYQNDYDGSAYRQRLAEDEARVIRRLSREGLLMAPVGQSMRSSKRPGVLLKPQTPMMDNSQTQGVVQKQSKGFGTLPNMPKPSNAGWHAAGPHGWLEPGGQINRSDVPAIDSGYGFPGAGQQPMPQYQPQFMPQQMQQPMAPQPVPQRPPVDVDQLIEAWNNIQGPKAPLAHFIENSKRSAGELPSFIPPDAQAMMNSPSGGPVGAPGGYAQPDVANPMVRDAISRFFMNGMRGNNDQMNNQERMINQRARINSVDSMMGNVAAPVMGGLMSMFTGGGAGNELAQDWNNKAYQRGNDLMNQRNQFINNAQQNTRDGFSMMQSSDPNTMKNQIAMMNAQANAQRANSYGQQVGNQGILGMGNLEYKNRELGQRGNQFTVEMAMKAKQMDQQLSMHLDDVKLRAQSNQISQQQANQEMQIAVMRNEQAKQQMAQQMQIATMGNAAQMRGQDFNAYNNYLGNQGANMRQAAALHWDKDGNPHPSSEEWFRQMFGAPAPPVQQTPVEAPNPISQFFGFGGQPQQAQNPVIETALQHYQSLPPQQRAALRPQFIQKFGQDPGN